MITTYHRFTPARRVAEYVGQSGHEANGQKLTYAAYDALAASKVTGIPCDLVVIGEYRREDGSSFLDFGTPRDHIEAASEHRWDAEAKRLRIICQLCQEKDGRHAKTCARR